MGLSCGTMRLSVISVMSPSSWPWPSGYPAAGCLIILQIHTTSMRKRKDLLQSCLEDAWMRSSNDQLNHVFSSPSLRARSTFATISLPSLAPISSIRG